MAKSRHTAVSFLALCVLGGATLLTMVLISPPAPLPADAPAADFSAARAMQDLALIAREPHPMGVFPAHAEVRDYLLSEIHALDLEPQVQKTLGVRVVRPGVVLGGFVENILVRLPGANPEGAILLMSHYDSTPGGPGGVDSGSGVVTVLELLRALHAGAPVRQDMIFLLTDGEEPGTFGSHAFVAQHPWFKDVRLVINLDQFSKGLMLLLHTNQGNGLWVQALARTVRRPTYMSLPDLFPGGETDLAPFAQSGIRGVDIQPLEGKEIRFEFSAAGPIQFLIVEEKTGLPSFPGLSTQPEPGTMESPGEFGQGVAADFTAIYRNFVVRGLDRE